MIPRSSDTEGDDDEVEEIDDDVPFIVPEGWKIGAWEPGDEISNFLVWTQLPGEVHRTWHVGVVARALPRPTIREGFTHDVCLDGTSQRRGLALSSATYEEGVWVLLQNSALALTNTNLAVDEECEQQLSPAPAALRAKRARRR